MEGEGSMKENGKKRIWSVLLAVLVLAGSCVAAGNTALTVLAEAPEEQKELLVEVGSAGYAEAGSGWAESGAIYSSDGTTKSRYNFTAARSVTWTADIETAGNYEVFLWRVNSTYGPKINLSYTGGIPRAVDWSASQEKGWVSLGEAKYTAGQKVTVTMSNPDGGTIRTGTVRLVPKAESQQPQDEAKLTVSTRDGDAYYKEVAGLWESSSVAGYNGGTRYSLSEGASVEWKPMVKEADTYIVQLYHPVHTTDVQNEVKLQILDAAGKSLKEETVVWNGTDQAGWIDLGSYALTEGQLAVRVTKTDRLENPSKPGQHDQALRADAVRLVKESEMPKPPTRMPQGTYYLDAAGGDDANSGTSPGEAWKTLDQVNGCEFALGSSILLKKGQSWTGKLAPKGSGAKDAPILLSGYGQGNLPVINGNGCENGAVELYNQEYWEIDGLEVTNMAPGETLGAEEPYNKDKNTATRHGIYVVLENIGGDGIVAKVCKSPLIQYNECNRACSRATGGNVNNAAVWVWQCKDAVIQYNEVYNTGLKGGNKDGQAFDSDFNCEGTVIQYNYSHDNDGGFVLLIAPSASDYNRDTIVRYNISQNDKKDIFEISGGVEGAQIYNNTIYQDLEQPTMLLRVNTYFATPKDEVLLGNNIFYSVREAGVLYETDNGRPLRGNFLFDTNLFYGYREPVSADREVNDYGTDGKLYTGHWTVTVKNSLNEDPRLKSPGNGGTGIDFADPKRLGGYQTAEASPCIDGGIRIPENGDLDFWGNRLYTEEPDIGAFEKGPDQPEDGNQPGSGDLSDGGGSSGSGGSSDGGSPGSGNPSDSGSSGSGNPSDSGSSPGSGNLSDSGSSGSGNRPASAGNKTRIVPPATGDSTQSTALIIMVLSGLVLLGSAGAASRRRGKG